MLKVTIHLGSRPAEEYRESEVATREMFYKKGVLKISQNVQGNTCARVSFLINLQTWGLQLY